MNTEKLILIIDDDEDIRETMRLALEAQSYKVATAENGELGFEKAKKENPDLIILDVMMRDNTEGFLTAQNIRSYDQTRYIPILMATSINQKSDFNYSPETDGEFLPVDGFMEKPLRGDAFKAEIKRLLSLTKEQINIKGNKTIL